MWGRLGEDVNARNINHLNAAMKQVEEISKDHTVYRSIVSLDEETAQLKGYTGREQWQQLVCNHVNTIAKENDIELKDLRWCAAYHHEQGHPHCHIVFWDNSDCVREEYMPEERFSIAMEKIRASFNGEIFKQELKALRKEQDTIKKELRANSRNYVEGYTELTFFSEDEEPGDVVGVNFYPKGLKLDQAKELCERIEELVYLLPESGQLKYQYLNTNVKRAVDKVSEFVLEQTTLKQLKTEMLKTVHDIAETYGNNPEAIERQIKFAERKIIKDIGNDVLSAVKEGGFMERCKELRLDALTDKAHHRIFAEADAVLSEKMPTPEFMEQFDNLRAAMGSVYMPKREAFKNPNVSETINKMTKDVMNDQKLRAEINVSQAFADKNESKDVEKTNEWRQVYRHISRNIYDSAAESNGWPKQQQYCNAVSFLMAFCGFASDNHRIIGLSGRFVFRRELSKQAKKEFYLEHKDASGMWEAETRF